MAVLRGVSVVLALAVGASRGLAAEPDDKGPDEAGPVVLTNQGGELRWEAGEGPAAGLSVVEAVPVPEVRAPSAVDRTPRRWPWPGGPHPLVAGMPQDSSRSVPAIAAYLRSRSDVPTTQLRILHDWLATHLEYDDVSPDSAAPDPAHVLEHRKAVCSGFARVFAEVAGALGLRAEVIIGHTRDDRGALRPTGHAWNAVEIDGRWRLVDVTWDVTRWTSGRRQPFSAQYFLVPPEVLRSTHLPKDARWQLAGGSLGRADFLAQPLLEPGFFAHDLRLVSPARLVLHPRGRLAVQVDNPRGRALTVSLAPAGRASRFDLCAPPSSAVKARFECAVPRHGEYELSMWVSTPGARHRIARWRVKAE